VSLGPATIVGLEGALCHFYGSFRKVNEHHKDTRNRSVGQTGAGVNLSVQVSLHSHLSKLSTGRSLLNLACGQIKENTNG
jgi:hypothetical protein